VEQRASGAAGRRLALALAGAALLSLLGGCLMPRRGTPVFVDARAGNFWSGEGLLLEVSPDQQRCRVAVRDRALLVQDRWVDCARVHPRKEQG
jgi:predicted oxidoreductase